MKQAVRWLLTVLLFAFFPIFNLFVENQKLANVGDLIIPSAIMGVFALGIYALTNLWAKDVCKAVLYSLIVLLIFFTHGMLYDTLYGFQIGNFIFARHRHVYIIDALLFVTLGIVVWRTKFDLTKVLSFLTVFVLALFIIPSIKLVSQGLKKKHVSHQNPYWPEAEKSFPKQLPSKTDLPDIYYIILDGYAREDVLKNLYGYDNREFLSYLREKDFFVASRSNSNYCTTDVSFPSFLNLNYLDRLADQVGQDSKNIKIAHHWVRNSVLGTLLKKIGYKYIHFSSGAYVTNTNDFADELWLNNQKLDEFSMVFFKGTMVAPFVNYFFIGNVRGRVLAAFDRLKDVPQIAAPTFTLVHIVSPHPPFVFGRTGEIVPEAHATFHGDIWQRRDLYVDQMAFINSKVQETVDYILEHSDKPPIIVIHADHGPASTVNYRDIASIRNPSDETYNEMLSILMAVHVPGGNVKLYDDMSPVNVFRLILNEQFGFSFDQLEDKSYYSLEDRPYDVRDITAIVETSEEDSAGVSK